MSGSSELGRGLRKVNGGISLGLCRWYVWMEPGKWGNESLRVKTRAWWTEEGRVLQVYARYYVQGNGLLGSPIGLISVLKQLEFDPVPFSNLNFPVRADVFGV